MCFGCSGRLRASFVTTAPIKLRFKRGKKSRGGRRGDRRGPDARIARKQKHARGAARTPFAELVEKTFSNTDTVPLRVETKIQTSSLQTVSLETRRSLTKLPR